MDHTLLLFFYCYFVLEFDFDVSIFGRPLEFGWLATRPTSARALLHAWRRPHKKQTQIINTYAGSLCVYVFVCVCVSVDRIAFEMRTLLYSKICNNGIFCPICGLSDLHCRHKQQQQGKETLLYSALFEIPSKAATILHPTSFL